jgi:hypothetical protein
MAAFQYRSTLTLVPTRVPLSDQVIFEQTLAALEGEVRGFGSYTDILNVKDVEVHRLGLVGKLAKAKEQINTFNSRELLFEKELTDYSQFDIILQSWEPFNVLWKTTYVKPFFIGHVGCTRCTTDHFGVLT